MRAFLFPVTGLRPIAMGLNRLRGRKDTQHCTPCLGSSLSARDWSSQRESGGTRPLMNESLRHALSGSATFATLGRRWSATTPWESIVKREKMQNKVRPETKTTALVEGATGQRYCSNCQQYRSVMGGQWRSFNGGMNRRWKCEACLRKTNT
jgi:hypothetical protein